MAVTSIDLLTSLSLIFLVNIDRVKFMEILLRNNHKNGRETSTDRISRDIKITLEFQSMVSEKQISCKGNEISIVHVIVWLRDRLVSQWVNYREIDATVSRSHVGPHPDRFGEHVRTGMAKPAILNIIRAINKRPINEQLPY